MSEQQEPKVKIIVNPMLQRAHPDFEWLTHLVDQHCQGTMSPYEASRKLRWLKSNYSAYRIGGNLHIAPVYNY